jgi:hypothetical protein
LNGVLLKEMLIEELTQTENWMWYEALLENRSFWTTNDDLEKILKICRFGKRQTPDLLHKRIK